MDDKIFRKKAIDKVSSPEELNDYVRVTNPGIWTVLLALAVLLAGLLVWGFLGSVDVKTVEADGTTITQSVRPVDYLFG